jgi:Fur family transcriptional regulator, peroxide stress response regulator
MVLTPMEEHSDSSKVSLMALSPEEVNARIDAFMEACRVAGVKVTHQRMEIFREVAGTEEHPDADRVYKGVRGRVPMVSLDTVYRGLALLEKLRVVSKVHILSERSRYDANTLPHHHFVCSRCGLIRDFSAAGEERFEIPCEVFSWGHVNSIHIELRGVCSTCATAGDADA